MADITPTIALDDQGNPGAVSLESADGSGDRQVRSRVRIRVPSNYRPDPVISTIVSRFGLTVNVLAALLGADRDSDGWFDLELNGSASQVESACRSVIFENTPLTDCIASPERHRIATALTGPEGNFGSMTAFAASRDAHRWA